MANKLHTDRGIPTFENILYGPLYKNTGDLEAATKTIIAIAEASGLGSADYSYAATLAIPTDARLVITRIATRLSVTIDSDDGTHDLRCRVYVDAQDANHLLFDVTYSTTGNQLSVQDCLVGTKETIFNLLKDGAAHTLYFYFWTPGNHAPVISLVNAWWGVGATGATATGWGVECLTFTATGLAKFNAQPQRIGSSSYSCSIMHPSGSIGDRYRISQGTGFATSPATPISSIIGLVGFRITDMAGPTDVIMWSELGIIIMRW
jgi:hypothetical protein